jgi:DNA-binding NarL/FixJ family response regulator
MDAHLALSQAERIATRLNPSGTLSATANLYPAGLTAREVEVLRLLTDGMSNTAIA